MRPPVHPARAWRGWLALGLPALSVVAAILCTSGLPLPLEWGIIPDLPLLLVIIWCVLQPRLMPSWLALLLGVLTDAAAAIPIGIHTTLFPMIAILLRLARARIVSRTAWGDWVMASLVILLAHLLGWQLMTFLRQPTALLPLLVQAGTTALAFPLAVDMAIRMQRRLVRMTL